MLWADGLRRARDTRGGGVCVTDVHLAYNCPVFFSLSQIVAQEAMDLDQGLDQVASKTVSDRVS